MLPPPHHLLPVLPPPCSSLAPPKTPNLSTSPRCAPIHPKRPRACGSGVRAGAGGEEQRGGSGAGKGEPKSCLAEAPRARSAGALKAGCALLFWRSHSSTGDKTWPWGWDEALRGFIAAGTEPPAPGAAQILRGGGTRAPRCGVGGARPGLGAKQEGTERKAGWGLAAQPPRHPPHCVPITVSSPWRCPPGPQSPAACRKRAGSFLRAHSRPQPSRLRAPGPSPAPPPPARPGGEKSLPAINPD